MASIPKFDLVNPKIQLNETETKISELLKDFTSKYNSKTGGEDLELRITGGWVRDKLLGDESNDLDIAINKLSGEEFAEALKQFLVDNFDTYQLSPTNIHKIEKNPEKSKHLETATTKLYGLDVDFVNLRSEEYTEESRIPIIKYGTPQEDALRRDATLNALFYNIQKDEVEDLTTKGLQDLEKGLLRTPLEPLKTFLDDPLRVLRLIRFASRFHFTIEKDTYESMKQLSIKEALIHKISRERIGVEVEKTLSSKDPIYGLELLTDAQLLDTIFNFGPLQDKVLEFNDENLVNEKFAAIQESASHSLNTIKEFNQESKISSVLENISSDKDLQKLFWLSVVLRKWGDEKVFYNAKKQAFASELIVKEGVKLSKADADIVTKLVSTTNEYQDIVSKLPAFKRSEVGLLLKQFGPYLNLSIAFNFFNSVIENGDIKSTIAQYELFHELIHKENLQDSYSIKPIVDGKTLTKKLNKKPGPWMGKVNEQILVWQLDNPTKTQDDCVEYVRSILESQ
ncbi:hypothetical protein BN7_2658 [Wickerhamomyces ciferrii]|uniref:CCA tRNA nucleotidyltransferase, mitochondrial n=1 Tax=Wickerhamomyces ciferrii (strain ATCC 14091 / BCRC 22168 / CBS 111 / JCM 3599 / NBRC 0793 / NRRL Y-1031 F-60-10) TaxID=1206466 RepID=K0KJF9_WICCF|nr:uncharacterized protein BN7_2658 [Wickerhamomyces ciferrii]CCH43111.1 hypothetical protein BN7_2658 [Wickerhamomyces ciferrii]